MKSILKLSFLLIITVIGWKDSIIDNSSSVYKSFHDDTEEIVNK